MRIQENLNNRIVNGISEALRSLAPKLLYDLLHMCVNLRLGCRALRGVLSYWTVETMTESYDPAPTHLFKGPKPSLEVKEGLSGQVLTMPRYEIFV